MLQPIQKDHELICPGCGAVVGQALESQEYIEKPKTNSDFNILLLGSAIEKNTKFTYRKTPQQVYEERTLKKLTDLVRKYNLPERFVSETFNELKRKNRGFRSDLIPIKQLLIILTKDDNYIYIHKMKLIKSEYEKLSKT